MPKIGWKAIEFTGYTVSLPTSLFLWHLKAYLRACDAELHSKEVPICCVATTATRCGMVIRHMLSPSIQTETALGPSCVC